MNHLKRTTLGLIAVFLLFLVSCCHGKVNCSAPPEKSCDFYEECLEDKYHCGPKGYPIGFGKKFCKLFESSIDEFTLRGQDFLWNNMHCLQVSLVAPFIDNNNTTPNNDTESVCQTLKQTALDSHASCFLQSGFCDTTIKDKTILARILLENDISDIFWSFIQQILDVLKGCFSDLLPVATAQ